MVNFDKFSSENTVIFDDFSPKITVVRPKYVPRGSIQEWGSIEADTVIVSNIGTTYILQCDHLQFEEGVERCQVHTKCLSTTTNKGVK